MENQLILVLQDDATRAALSGLLRQQGYSLVGQPSGAAGLDYLSRCHVHLLILETQLVDGSGLDFCRQIRQQGYHQPILMLSDRDHETDKVLALEMGADDYMTKPYNPREMLSRIRALLRRAYGEFAHVSGEQLCLGDLVIDRIRGQASCGGKSLSLTPIEFRLLVHLAQHVNQVLSRAQILDAVWGFEVDVNSERIVNTHICRLRGKIEADRSRLTIQTVSGFGYRLETKSL